MIFSNYYFYFQKNARYYNVPALFLEVPICNLNCVMSRSHLCTFASASKCTNDIKQENFYSEEQIKDVIANMKVNHIVIGGGEPLLYKNELEKFLDEIWQDDFVITIKTNGTKQMLNPLNYNYKISLYDINLRYNVQPKEGDRFNNVLFGTQECLDLKEKAYNPKNLLDIIIYGSDYLITLDDDNWLEKTDEIIKDIYKEVKCDELGKSILDKRNIKSHFVIKNGETDKLIDNNFILG